jgi:hypothetical protein
MRVFVYFNLHKKVWSVRALDGPMKGKVIRHTQAIILHDCVCKVSQAGRRRVLLERRKNVHAGVVGTVVDVSPRLAFDQQLTYNPYKYETFVNKATLMPVLRADWVRFAGKQVHHT